MRILLTISLLIFTLIDFSVASVEIKGLDSSDCNMSKTDMAEEARHMSSHGSDCPGDDEEGAEKHNHNSCEDNCHCECHVGHIHTALFYDVIESTKMSDQNYRKTFPLFVLMSVEDFYSRLNRPPILS